MTDEKNSSNFRIDQELTAIPLLAETTVEIYSGGSDIRGGAIFNSEFMTLSNAEFLENTALSCGGAIYNEHSGSMTMTSALFSGNNAGSSVDSSGPWTASGGAVYNAGRMVISSASFNDNYGLINAFIDVPLTNAAPLNVYGGAVYNTDEMELLSASFSGNCASAEIYSSYDSLTSGQVDCSAFGGAVYNTGSMTLSSASFSGNSAYTSAYLDEYTENPKTVFASAGGHVYGGAVYNTGSMTLSSASFGGNHADTEVTASPSAESTGPTGKFTENCSASATGYGGAVYNIGRINLSSAFFNENCVDVKASAFAGLYLYEFKSITVNQAGTASAIGYGGAVYNSGRIDFATVSFNGNNASATTSVCIDVNGEAVPKTSFSASADCCVYGGAVYNTGSAVMSSASFNGNSIYASAYTEKVETEEKPASLLETAAVSGYGGAVYNTGTGIMTLSSASFSGNQASADLSVNAGSARSYITGGAVCNAGSMDMSSASFNENAVKVSACASAMLSAYGDGLGGAVCNTGSMTLSSASFSKNCASADAVTAADSLNKTTAFGSVYGGAVYNSGYANISSASFIENTALATASASLYEEEGAFGYGHGFACAHGGAVFNLDDMTLSSASFSKNCASASLDATIDPETAVSALGYAMASGGAVCNSGIMSLTSGSFAGNTALANAVVSGTVKALGGAIYNSGSMDLTLMSFNENTVSASAVAAGDAEAYGGAVYNAGIMTLSNVTFSGNKAVSGGAVYNEGTLVLTGTTALKTESDTIYNAGTIEWNLADSTATNLSISDYSLVNNQGTLNISISKAGGPSQKYILAENAKDADDTFNILIDGKKTFSLNVNQGKYMYNGFIYELYTTETSSLVFSTEKKLIPITITAGSAEKIYDGTALTTDTYTCSGTLEKGDTISVTMNGSVTNAGTADNVIADYKIMNGTEDVTWKYDVTCISGTLTVDKRNVAISSANDRKVYDGAPLTNDTIIVSGDKFAEGEGASYNVTGSQTEIGSSENTFSYSLKDGTLAENYDISVQYGTLEVEKRSPMLDDWYDLKEKGAAGHVGYFGNFDIGASFTDEVGKDDLVDYLEFTLDHASNVVFTVASGNAVNFSINALQSKTDKKGTTTYSLKTLQNTSLKADTVTDTKNLLLYAGTYYIGMTANDKKSANAEYTITVSDQTIIYDRNDNTDDWTDMNTKGAASEEFKEFGTVSAETIGTYIIGNDWVGIGDSVDYMEIDLEHAGKLSFTLNASDKAKFKIYSLQSKTDKKGITTYSLKSLQGTEIKAGVATDTKLIVLTAGTYYLETTSTNKKDGNAGYSVLLNGQTIIYDRNDNTDDWTDMKTRGASSEEFKEFGTVSAETIGTYIVGNDWVGIGDSVDYMEIDLEHAGKLSFTLNASDKAKFKIYSLQSKTDKKGITTYSLKSLQGTEIKAGVETDTKTIVLTAGTYYLETTSTNKKDGNAGYSVLLNGQTIIYDRNDNTDDWRDMKTMGAASEEFKEFGTVSAETIGTYIIGNDWVGIGDSVDYMEIDLEHAGKLSFTLNASDKAKFMIYSLQSKTDKKGITTYSLKALQKTVIKVEEPVDTKSIILNAGTYYLAMISANTKDGNADYSIRLNENSVIYDRCDNTDDNWQTTEKVLAENTAVADWVGIGDLVDYRVFTTDENRFGNFKLYNVSEKTTLTVYTEHNGKLKSVKSVSATAKNSAETGALLLIADTKYYIGVETKAVSADYTLEVVNSDSFNTANNSLESAEKVDGEYNGTLTKNKDGDSLDYISMEGLESLGIDMNAGSIKVSFLDKDGNAVQVKNLVDAAGKEIKTTSGLTLKNGDKSLDSIDWASIDENVKYLKINAGSDGLCSYTLASL